MVDRRGRDDETLAEREARLRALFASIDEGYCLCEIVIDPGGRPVDYRFLEINGRFEELTGLRDALGRTIRELEPDIEQSWIENCGRVALGGTPLRWEDRSDALGRWFDVFATPVEPRGRFAVVFSDVSARKHAEAVLRERELAARRVGRQAELLADIAAALDAAGGHDAAVDRLLELLVPAIADFATIEVPDAEEPVVAIAHRDPARLPLLRRLREQHRSAPGDPGSIASVAAGRAHLVARITPDVFGEFGVPPQTARLLRELGLRSTVAVPLEVGGRAGALLLGRSEPTRPAFTGDDQAFARRVAERAGLILARERARESEHRVALRLQQALLPDALVQRPGLELAARYEASSSAMEVGGDWYDSYALDDDRVGLVVGDVMGHGLDAAAAMGRLRVALAALVPHADGPAQLLEHLDAFNRGPDGAGFATAAYVELDLRRRRLRLASAGHLPPLVVTPAGDSVWLTGGRSTVLSRLGDSGRTEASHPLERGSLIVMASDGLVERRGEVIDEGLERLRRVAVAARRLPLAEVCDRIVAGLGVAASREDDVVVLCARLSG